MSGGSIAFAACAAAFAWTMQRGPTPPARTSWAYTSEMTQFEQAETPYHRAVLADAAVNGKTTVVRSRYLQLYVAAELPEEERERLAVTFINSQEARIEDRMQRDHKRYLALLIAAGVIGPIIVLVVGVNVGWVFRGFLAY